MKKLAGVLLALAVLSFPVLAQTRGLAVIAKALGGENAVAGRQYAVLIAIDSYKEWMPLKNPVKDAKELREILTGRYYFDQVLELYNADATKSGVLRLFDTLIKSVKPEDSVLIYYAGHGQLDDTETGFWIPVDGGTDRFEQRNWIPNIQIRNNIGKMKARHVALLSDSCFSGDILNPTRGAAPAIDQSYFGNAWSRVSRQVLTSGASESVPDQSEFSQQLKLALLGNTQPYLDPLMIFGQVRLGMKRSTPLFGDLKDSGHQDGASYLLFLRNPGDIGTAQVSGLAPASGSGELSVSASMEGAEVFVDGVSYGKSPALARGLPSGRPLKVSARLGAFSGFSEITLEANELREVSLELERMKSNLLVATGEKTVSVFIDGEAKGPLGSGLFRELPAGEVSLELKGEGLYYQGRVSLKGGETTKVSAEPRPVGSLAYEAPADAWITIVATGYHQKLGGTGKVENLAVGRYRITTADIGYGAVTQNIDVAKGKTVSFRLEAPGAVEIHGIPSNVAEVSSGTKTLPTEGKDSVVLPGLVPGKSTIIHFKLLADIGWTNDELRVTPRAGETLRVEAPSGRLSFEWLPASAKVLLNAEELPVALSPASPALSATILARGYHLTVSMPGIGTYSERVEVVSGSERSVTGLTTFVLDTLKAQRVKRRALDTSGWVSLGVGLLGAAGAGAGYFLGAQAMDAYKNATVSSDIAAARDKADLYGGIFTASAIIGGAALGLSPLLWTSGPSKKRVEASMRELQAQIDALQRATR